MDEIRRQRHTGASDNKKHKTGTSGHPSGSTSGSRIRHRIRRWSRLLLFPVFILYEEIMLRLTCGQNPFFRFGYILLFSISFGLFLSVWIQPFGKKANRLIADVILVAVSCLFATECIIKSVFVTYMAPTNLTAGAGNVGTKYGGEMARSIIFGIPRIVLFFIPYILFLIFGERYVPMKKRPWKKALRNLVFSLIFFVPGVLWASNGRDAAIYGSHFVFNRATETFGLVTSTRLSLRYSIFGSAGGSFHAENTGTEAAESAGTASGDAALTPAVYGKNEMDLDFASLDGTNETVTNLDHYFESLTPTDKNAYTGLFAGKNLILICAESYCGDFISEELTPALWRLTHNGFYFSDYYQPEWGGSTTTGELSYLVGLAPNDGDESMVNIANNNNYFTMGNQLQRLGYSSAAFHNGSYDYYSRNLTHENLGYNQFIANETGLGALCGGEWMTDTSMLTHTFDLYKDAQPFSIYYMTISGHAPYDADSELVTQYYDRVNAVVGDTYAEKTKYYICYQMEMENMLETLVSDLENAGIADDTVIALVGDHYPYGLGSGEAWGNDRDYIDDLIKGDDSIPWERDRNTLIIWSGCLENENKDMACEISTPVYSLDILPTLSNLFGVTYDSRLLPGRDVFSNAEPLVLWYDLSWVTTRGKYNASTEEFTPNDGYAYDQAYVDSVSQIVENKLLMSRAIMDNDYYGLLFGPDDVTFAGKMLYNGEAAASSSAEN